VSVRSSCAAEAAIRRAASRPSSARAFPITCRRDTRRIGNPDRDIGYKATGLREHDVGTRGTKYRNFGNAASPHIFE